MRWKIKPTRSAKPLTVNNQYPLAEFSSTNVNLKGAEMITSDTAKNKIKDLTAAAADQLSNVTTNEKIAGAAALGVVVGAAAAAIGSAMLNSDSPSKKTTKAAKKPAA